MKSRKRRLAWEPTSTLVGSPERAEVYRRRVAAGLPVFHPRDSRERVLLTRDERRERGLRRNNHSKDLPRGINYVPRCTRRPYRARVFRGRRGTSGANGITLGYFTTLAEAVEALQRWHIEQDGRELGS